MVNAWSLAASILDGTFDTDYPIMTKKKVEHSDAYYDYTRNDPDRENPFTDAFDHLMAESVTGKSPWIYESPDGGTTVTRRKSGDDHTKKEVIQGDYFGDKYPYVGDSDAPSEFTTLSDNDDQIAHHVGANPYSHFNYEPKRNHQYKYHEEEILKDVEEYVSSTYQGHYTGNAHEFRKVQTIDLMASKDLASAFCQANILKYGSRYGNKDGKNKKDLLKVIHYAMLLLHFDDHYGKPSMTSGNIDHNMP